jgi:hypothetical protein
MPEYLAPGVFVEETSFRAKSIEGVGTSTTAFVGMTARGPISLSPSDPTPPLLTSFGDFERYYGGVDDIRVGANLVRNHVALAAYAYFNNGGGRLYVARIPGAGGGAVASSGNLKANTTVKLKSRYPGSGGTLPNGSANYRVLISEEARPTTKKLALLQPKGTTVRVDVPATVQTDPPVRHYFTAGIDPSDPPSSGTPSVFQSLGADGELMVVTIGIEVTDASGTIYEAGGLGLHPQHPRYIGTIMGANPPRKSDLLSNPVVIDIDNSVDHKALREALLDGAVGGVRTADLSNGSVGTAAPAVASYQAALTSLLALEDISIIAAPGSSADENNAAAINLALIANAESRRAYRIAVLDTPEAQDIAEVRAFKSILDSKYAALYYPWIRVSNPAAETDPLQPTEIDVPPSGAVCGIYARSDIERGVWKAPANETVRGALDLQRDVRFGEQEVLNPLGINCIRKLPNRGIRVWGARTLSSDPEWKYVNIRRYFIYLEASIDRGTQWAVFEPNGEALWANVRTTVSDFLYNEWMNGALLGGTPKEAFFVRCDRSTMTQNDLDNGRLVCQVGVAAIKPAEFVIFKIGQKTADARG